MTITETLLRLGRIVATPGALEALARAGQDAKCFLERHASGDWGELDEHERAENDYSFAHGFRISSSQIPPASGWLDEWGRLKGGCPGCSVIAS